MADSSNSHVNAAPQRRGLLNVLLVVGASSAALLAVGIVVAIFALLRFLPNADSARAPSDRPAAQAPAAAVPAAPAARVRPASAARHHPPAAAVPGPAGVPAAVQPTPAPAPPQAARAPGERNSDTGLNRAIAGGLAGLGDDPEALQQLKRQPRARPRRGGDGDE